MGADLPGQPQSSALLEMLRLMLLTPTKRADELAALEAARRAEEERIRVASAAEWNAVIDDARWGRCCRKWASKHRRVTDG